MSRPHFTARADGGLDVFLDPTEVELLRTVAAGLEQVVGDPSDPSRARLFPPAHPEDDSEQDEWDRMTRSDLEAERARAVAVVLGSLESGRMRRGRWTAALSPDEHAAWLGVVNDARLVWGIRLGVTEQSYEEPPAPGGLLRPAFDVYLWLGWLLSEMLEAIDPSLSGPFESD